jgi:hypothetical protein
VHADQATHAVPATGHGVQGNGHEGNDEATGYDYERSRDGSQRRGKTLHGQAAAADCASRRGEPAAGTSWGRSDLGQGRSADVAVMRGAGEGDSLCEGLLPRFIRAAAKGWGRPEEAHLAGDGGVAREFCRACLET